VSNRSVPGNATPPPASGRPSVTPAAIAVVALVIVAALIYAFVTTTGGVSDAGGSLIRLGRPALQPGDMAPALNVKTREGITIDSQVLRNNVVVVNFFASWCKPCQEEAADLEAAWKEYRPRGVFFLGLTYQDVDAKVAEFIKSNGISYLVANDDGSLAKGFGLTGVPETYIIGRDGRLIFKQIGPIQGGALRAELDKLVK
jgi:cytochrome c biogenesis protein CcmG, thiol:disulfide interchange protein DsbE